MSLTVWVGTGGTPARQQAGPTRRLRQAGMRSSAVFRSMRPVSSLVPGILSGLAVVAARGRLSLPGLAAGAAMSALTAFGFVVNDIFDCHKDRAAGIRRPIAAGELTIRGAALLAIALLVCAGLLSLAAGAGGKLLVLTCAALLLYSPVAQRFPLTKGIYVAGLCCVPLFYGSVVGGTRYPWVAYLPLIAFVLGREALMDSDEAPGDSRSGIRTIAAVLGPARARQFALGFMLLALAGTAAIASGVVGEVAAASALVCWLAVFTWPGLEESLRIRLSRYPMLIGAVAIACST